MTCRFLAAVLPNIKANHPCYGNLGKTQEGLKEKSSSFPTTPHSPGGGGSGEFKIQLHWEPRAVAQEGIDAAAAAGFTRGSEDRPVRDDLASGIREAAKAYLCELASSWDEPVCDELEVLCAEHQSSLIKAGEDW